MAETQTLEEAWGWLCRRGRAVAEEDTRDQKRIRELEAVLEPAKIVLQDIEAAMKKWRAGELVSFDLYDGDHAMWLRGALVQARALLR
jgi:hypothetical protein